MRVILPTVLLLLSTLILRADPTAAEDPGLQPMASFEIGSMRDQLLDPPPDIARVVAIEFASLERHRGVALNITHDGTFDYLFSQNPNDCGIGGCPLIYVDGSQKKVIGRFYGNPVFVLKKAINGRPILGVYKSEGAAGGYYSIYIYEGKEYTEVSSVFLEGVSLQKQLDKLKIIVPGKR